MGKKTPGTSRMHTKSQVSNIAIKLTDVQRLKVEVINWKRCTVRSLLIISYATLIQMLIFLGILVYGYPIISESLYHTIAVYGYIFSLFLYFFGSGSAVKAISYAWVPLKYLLGQGAIILGIFLTFLFYFIGTSKSYAGSSEVVVSFSESCINRGHPVDDNETAWVKQQFRKFHLEDDFDVCMALQVLKGSLRMIPFFLPPISVVCSVLAIFSAFEALYVVPRKLPRGTVDAIWLEPYQVYDFYVGRTIPKIPGYDEDDAENGSHKSASYYSVSMEDVDVELEK